MNGVLKVSGFNALIFAAGMLLGYATESNFHILPGSLLAFISWACATTGMVYSSRNVVEISGLRRDTLDFISGLMLYAGGTLTASIWMLSRVPNEDMTGLGLAILFSAVLVLVPVVIIAFRILGRPRTLGAS